jgi:hypothetical protein
VASRLQTLLRDRGVGFVGGKIHHERGVALPEKGIEIVVSGSAVGTREFLGALAVEIGRREEIESLGLGDPRRVTIGDGPTADDGHLHVSKDGEREQKDRGEEATDRLDRDV